MSALKAKVSEETVDLTVKIEDYRFWIAVLGTAGYIALLAGALIATAAGSAGLFETVAAAVSGPIGAILGYYFGAKTKPEGE